VAKHHLNANVSRRAILGAILSASAIAGTAALATPKGKARPNVVIILADDMGWGDIEAYNPQSAVPTPNLNRLANRGTRFNDMHSSSAVCTPSRYALMTGRYHWRTKLKRGVLQGYSPALIEPGRTTLPALLKQSGYYTAGVGKWHLGLGNAEKVNYAKPLTPGPNDVGFDYYYGIPASLDMAPYLYFENDRAVGELTDYTKGGAGPDPVGAFWREGPTTPGFDFDQVLPNLTNKACEVIDQRAGKDQPFFLYVPLPAPHTPWLPLPEYRGKSRAGDYGDFAHQTDAMIGKIIATLEDKGVFDDTIVIFTSDNGAFWRERELAMYPHRSNGEWRGMKSDAFEGGHRIPFLISWPGRAKPGGVSNEMGSLVDVMATIASGLGLRLPDDAAEDSFSLSDALGSRSKSGRQYLIASASSGLMSIRDHRWKLILGPGSGGFTALSAADAKAAIAGQLYDLENDPAERHNLWHRHPDIVARLTTEFERAEKAGRTRPTGS
jgi:arylsulfatase A